MNLKGRSLSTKTDDEVEPARPAAAVGSSYNELKQYPTRPRHPRGRGAPAGPPGQQPAHDQTARPYDSDNTKRLLYILHELPVLPVTEDQRCEKIDGMSVGRGGMAHPGPGPVPEVSIATNEGGTSFR